MLYIKSDETCKLRDDSDDDDDDVDVDNEPSDPGSQPGHGCCSWQYADRGSLPHEHGAARRLRG